MSATTIKVSAATRDRLNELARERGTTAGSVVEQLLEAWLREQRFAQMRAALAATPPEEAAGYAAETAAWDATLADGLATDDTR